MPSSIQPYWLIYIRYEILYLGILIHYNFRKWNKCKHLFNISLCLLICHLLHSETLPVMRTSTLGPRPHPRHPLHSETLPVMRTWPPWSWRNPTQRNLKWGAHWNVEGWRGSYRFLGRWWKKAGLLQAQSRPPQSFKDKGRWWLFWKILANLR